MFNLTPLVRNLIIINVVAFLVNELRLFPLTQYMALYELGTSLFRPYQLFTYMFAHGSFMHIFFNMLMLAFTGATLEMIWGPQRFLFYYVATGIGAALIYLGIGYFLNPNSMGSMVGASGAIYGLLMGFGLTMPDREVRLLIPPINIKAKYLVFVLGGMTYLLDRSGKTAHLAHFGGALVGFLMIKVFKF